MKAGMKLFGAALAIVTVLSLGACKKKTAGEKLGDALEDAGKAVDDAAENFERDPSFDVVQGVYSACLNDYVRRELRFESDLPYEILSFKVFPKWKYDEFQNNFVNVAETLRGAMMKNPHLKLFVANGIYDLATPFYATEYTMNHLGLRDDVDKNVTMAYYDAGHMMYTHKPSLKALSGDLKKFIRRSS